MKSRSSLLRQYPYLNLAVHQPGAIFRYSGHACISWIIRLFTLSSASHVSIATHLSKYDVNSWREQHNKPIGPWEDGVYIVESTDAKDPCLLNERSFSGVQVQPLDSIQKYDGRVEVMLPIALLNQHESYLLTNKLLELVGTEYDRSGAILAGTRAIKWLPCWKRKVHDRYTNYCAEVVGEGVKSYGHLRNPEVSEVEPGVLRPRDMSVFHQLGLYTNPLKLK